MMKKKKKFKMGQKAVCKSCGKEIEYVGPYWRHTTYSPRHIAIPKEEE
jgi:hypothetical protein